LFGEHSYVNWELAEGMMKRSMNKRKVNCIGGMNIWYYLMLYLQGDQQTFQTCSQLAKAAHRPFTIIVETCNNEFAGTPVQVDFSTMVRLFFTIHLAGIQAVHAISTMLNPLVSKHTMHVSASYAQNIALKILEEKFTPSQYIDTVHWLVAQGIILENSIVLQREVDFHYEHERKNPTNVMKMQCIQANKTSRPSLIAISKNKRHVHFGKLPTLGNHTLGNHTLGNHTLGNHSGCNSTPWNEKVMTSLLQGSHEAEKSMSERTNASAMLMSSLTLDGYFTFQGFKQFMKFPSNFSPLMQQRAYWLASQCNFDWKMYIRDFLPRDLCATLVVSLCMFNN
jgi:hypothetical protein